MKYKNIIAKAEKDIDPIALKAEAKKFALKFWVYEQAEMCQDMKELLS
jgi:hypothetical protein